LDRETIISFTKGDLNAFACVVREYSSFLMSVVIPIVRDSGQAEDVLQETFLQVYRSSSSYRGGNFKYWLARIATNKALDWKRKVKTNYEEKLLGNAESGLEVVTDGISTEDRVLQKELFSRLRKICARLPLDYANTILGFYLEGKSTHALALEAGVSRRTIESRLYRGKKMLKKMWEEEFS